jgi:hypothetical protein
MNNTKKIIPPIKIHPSHNHSNNSMKKPCISPNSKITKYKKINQQTLSYNPITHNYIGKYLHLIINNNLLININNS